MSDRTIQVEGLHKTYALGRTRLHVLRGVSFAVDEGEFVTIVGASGSGKSTLLHLVGLLDRPDKGRIVLSGADTATLSAAKRNRMRCEHIGFVFQFYHLLPELNVLENTMLPARADLSVAKWLRQRRPKRKLAGDLLDRLGLAERLKHRPKELSGGERQRVAIARALMNAPKVLLADEPTGNLDSHIGQEILNVLKDFHGQAGQTILMVTHDADLAAQADRVLHLRDGRLAKS